MSNKFAILRTEKIKDWSAVSGSGAHNLRLGNYGNNVDEEKSHLNRYIIKPKDNDLNKHIRERFKECEVEPKWYGNKHKNNSVIAIEVFMGVSNGFFDNKEPEVLDKWIELNEKYLKDKFGEENIASLTLHYDETTPHLQAHITPIVEYKDENQETKYKLSAKDLIGGHKNKHHLEQTKYAERFKGIGLERGEVKSKDRHMSTTEYNKIVNKVDRELKKHTYYKVEKPPLLMTGHKKYQEKLQDRIDFLTGQANAYLLRAEIAEGKVNGKRMREIEESLEEKDGEVNKLKKQVKNLTVKLKKANERKGHLAEETEEQLNKIYNLEDRNKELETENESLKSENKSLRVQNKKLSRKMEKAPTMRHR